MKTSLSFDDVLLVPKKFSGKSRKKIDISTKLKSLELSIPIIAANMPSVCETEMAIAIGELGGLGIIHRMQSVEEQASMVYETSLHDILVGGAIGIGNDWKQRTKRLLKCGANVICLDVAHGHQDEVLRIVSQFKKLYPSTPLIVGNFAVAEGGLEAEEAGGDICKFGVGGGSMCSTRIQTGCGVPTWQSIQDAFECGVDCIIADGGIRNSGDIVKSLAAGANAVMLGSLLAGTYESPGEVIKGTDGKKYKIYRGAASFGAKKEFFGEAEYVEGEETLVPYKGAVSKIIKSLCEGIRSGLSYCGAHDISQLQDTAEFTQITVAGAKESKPHGLL